MCVWRGANLAQFAVLPEQLPTCDEGNEDEDSESDWLRNNLVGDASYRNTDDCSRDCYGGEVVIEDCSLDIRNLLAILQAVEVFN